MVIANVSNTLIMYMRVKAVFRHSKPIVYMFTGLWVACVASYLISAYAPKHDSFTDSPDGPASRSCTIVLPSGQSLVVGTAVLTVNDTCVFVAIAYRLLSGSFLSDTSPFKALLNGRGLGSVSRALLKTGNQYYL